MGVRDVKVQGREGDGVRMGQRVGVRGVNCVGEGKG